MNVISCIGTSDINKNRVQEVMQTPRLSKALTRSKQTCMIKWEATFIDGDQEPLHEATMPMKYSREIT